ncbi:hypothetical protein GCU68_17085 (plasmid) [Natronorubrum aibiense]|uniref:DUF8053 domain-containing protein n=1 Tax=Natronorubrum aibiense TaxID=348826 RepID=A0A5P9P833_9EURY|nr:hypothetical protein GCU68_17085 [Natronorubrum aibiense]
MPIHQLVQVGRTSGGVVLPKSEVRALGCVGEDGNVKSHPMRITQTDDATSEVSLIDPNDFPDAEAEV